MRITKADQLLEQALNLLKELEYSDINVGEGDYVGCSVCLRHDYLSHTKDCSLAQTIQDIKAYLQEKKDTSVPVDHERGSSKLFKA